MISTSFQLLVAISLTSCYPQKSDIPGITNFSPPEDVNGLAHHHQARSIERNLPPSNSLEETVKEVEAMLKSNPQLPRLTRGEILDLLENITKNDQSINKIVPEVIRTPERDPKAIMVVLPYTAENSNNQTVEDLYTKAPITHIVHAQTFQKAEQVASSQSKQQVVNTYTLDTDEYNKPTGEKVKKFRGNYHRIPTTPTSSAKPHTVPSSTEPSKQVYFTENKVNMRRRRPQHRITSTTTPHPVTTRRERPIRRRPSMATTTEKHPNHKYPEESNSALTVVAAPELSPHVINEDLLMVEDQNNEVLNENDRPVSFERVTIREIDVSESEATTALSPIKIDVPEKLKGIVDDIDLESAIPKQPTASKNHQDLSVSKEDEIRHMLASLGVFPSQISSTTTQIPDISNVADNLTPDMRELLMSFGLISASKEKLASASQVLDSYNPVEPKIDPQAYIGFKPLPEGDNTRKDMEEFLAKFGLGRSTRSQEIMKEGGDERNEEHDLNFEMVPEKYQGVLEDIGLSDRNGKMIRSESPAKVQGKHSFNPSDIQYASNEEIEKLNKLIAIVKKLESLNRTLTDADLKKIDMENLKDLVQSLQVRKVGDVIVPLDEQHAPNPNDYDYGLTKNEVKRQEDKEGNNGTTSTSTSPITEETATPNIKDLEDSFGGNSEAATETTEPETTTARRKTGFYYLVDWNTFLDIDDQKGKRVNLRFQPTIGDPKRFYSVSVP